MTKNLSRVVVLFGLIAVFNFACQKEDRQSLMEKELASSAHQEQGHLKQAKTFSSDVVTTWLNQQLKMVKIPLPLGTGSQSSDRCQAYCGIAVYEAVVPGMPAYQSLSGQLTGFTGMPVTEPGKAYHWAASANAALAEMNRRLFPTTAESNKLRMDELEDSLNAVYATEVDEPTLERSIAFGKEVATRVFAWASSDGSANVNPPYVPISGPGLWLPTALTPPVGAYIFQRRLLVPGSDNNTTLQPPPSFSTDPSSAFYAMNKDVYDVSKSLTVDQKAMADYFKDAPGYAAGGGFVYILMESLNLSKPTLDHAVVSYAKVGLAQHDATIVLFTNKYRFNLIRPVTYINAVIDADWKTYITTPNHPEFPSGHATTNGAALTMMSNSFGENFPITLHIYDYLGYPSRSYNTFTEISNDMSNSRIYGGLHYRATCEKSLVQGRKVAENILNTVRFLK